jgi:1,4-alpha-glucan branching enzyme
MGTPTLWNPRNMGAIPSQAGVHFRVWAPFASSVGVAGDFNGWNAARNSLHREEGGFWAGSIPEANTGQAYQYELENNGRTFRKNDPYSREIHPEKRTSLIYQSFHRWTHLGFQPAPLNEMVIYELHVGTFSSHENNAPGKFSGVIRRLPYLKNLGVNAIEIMPATEFPSERSWGYNVTNPFAVEESYGGPEGLKQLIDAAHAHGIAVILDVVYNHFGPDNLDLWQFDGWNENNLGGIYFYNDWRAWTPWGDNRPDYGREEVRQFIRDNVFLWLEDFHADGLRFDSTLFMRDTRGNSYNPETEIPAAWSLLQWINCEVARHFPGKIMIAEDLGSNPWITKPPEAGGAGFTAQWDACFVHPIRRTITQVQDGDRNMDEVKNAIQFQYNDRPVERVIYSESHDEVANGKARVPTEIHPDDPSGYFAQKRSVLAAGLVLTVPGIPMLFEGQEFLETGWFQDEVPVDWSKLDAFRGINALYRDFIHARRNLRGQTCGLLGSGLRVLQVNQKDKVIGFHRWHAGGTGDDVVVVANFSNRSFENYRMGFPRSGTWHVRINSDWKGYSPYFENGTPPVVFLETGEEPFDGLKNSGTFAIGPYAVLVFSQDG